MRHQMNECRMKKWIVLAALLLSINAFAQTTEQFSIDGHHGMLSAVLQKPALTAGQKCDLVIVMHGFMGNKNQELMQEIANRLQEEGIASLRFDFNGHGESEGRFRDMTVPNEIEDALKVYEYAASLSFVNNIAIAGHSQGGVVASMTSGILGKDKVKALVLLAPAAVLREDAIRGNTMGATYNPLDPPEYVRLPFGVELGAEYIRTAFSLPIFETASPYKGPVCLIHGTGDNVVPYTYSLRYEEKYDHAEVHLLEGEDHMFSKDLKEAGRIALEFLSRQLKFYHMMSL